MTPPEPSDAELLGFDQGLLDEAAMERIARWLEAHPQSEERLARLATTAMDGAVNALRAPSADDPSGDPELVNQVFLGALGELPGDRVPASVRDYRLGRLIGKGGMGAVYEARHAFMERDVALKLLPVQQAADPAFRARFQRETALIGQFDHPNLVRAFDAGAEGNHLFLAMERLQGKDLADVVAARGRLAVADACEIVRQAALGLEHAHQHGIVHRDVKPSNLFLTRTGTVKVIDLGLARAHSGHGLTSALTVMGTPEYMAPEQWEAATVGPPADLYALGCTLFCLLSGHPPFAGKGDTWVTLMDAHRGQPAPPLQPACPEAPPALCELLQRLLRKAPAERPGSARELAEALLPFTAGHDLPALLTPASARAQPRLQTHSSLTQRLARSGAGSPRRRPIFNVLFVLIGSTFALALAGLLYGLFTAEPEPAATFPAELEPAHTWTAHTARVLGLAIAPDGSLVASGGDDNVIWLWDVKSGQKRGPLRGHPGGVVTLAFAPDGKTLASATPAHDDCHVRLWDVASGALKRQLGDRNRGIWTLAYSPDGTLLACGGFDEALFIFDVASGKNLHTIPHVTTKRFVRTLSISAEKQVVVGGNDVARVFDAVTGREIPAQLPAQICPTFLPGGKRIASWSYLQGSIVLCDVPSGQNVIAWRAHTPVIEGLAVSPCGRFLASTGADGAALWSAANGQLLTRLVGHRGVVGSVVFAPDMTFVVTSGQDDCTVRVWELPAAYRNR